MTGVLKRRWPCEDRDTGRTPCEDEGQDHGDATEAKERQRLPANQSPEWGRHGIDFFMKATSHANTLTLAFWSPEQ